MILWRGLEIPSNYGSSQKEKEKKILTSLEFYSNSTPAQDISRKFEVEPSNYFCNL